MKERRFKLTDGFYEWKRCGLRIDPFALITGSTDGLIRSQL